MSERVTEAETAREPVLNPVDRVSELLFGLFMALTFVGAVSVAESGRAEIRAMLIAALGCNLAWGLVDAVMYLVRTVTDRGRSLTLIRSVRRRRRGSRAQADRGRAVVGDDGARLGDGDRGDPRPDRRAARPAGAAEARSEATCSRRWRSS